MSLEFAGRIFEADGEEIEEEEFEEGEEIDDDEEERPRNSVERSIQRYWKRCANRPGRMRAPF